MMQYITQHVIKRMREQKERDISVHDICFEMLQKELCEVLKSGKAVELQSLLSMYKEYLKQHGYENYDSYTVQRLRDRFKSYYKDKVSFTTEVNKRQSIYNSEISIADAINTASAYKQMLHDQKLLRDSQRNAEKNIIERAIEILRIKID